MLSWLFLLAFLLVLITLRANPVIKLSRMISPEISDEELIVARLKFCAKLFYDHAPF
jgi:hypothetical protein